MGPGETVGYLGCFDPHQAESALDVKLREVVPIDTDAADGEAGV
jgi:hypothetical protein